MQVNSKAFDSLDFADVGNHTSSTISAYPQKMEPQHFIQKPTSLPNSVLCVAAAAVEFVAIRCRLDTELGSGEIISIRCNRDFVIKYTDGENGTIWYLLGLSFQGETEAALGVNAACAALNPSIVLMIGMCMGMPKRDLPVGTVVVPNEVFCFDHQRLTSDGLQYRPHGNRVDNGLYKLARVLASENNIEYKVVADKALASASVKIEDAQADMVKKIEDTFPDAAAFDMEGWGFYLAGDEKPCLWVKAVADRGEPQEHAAAGRNEKQYVQKSVTDNATDFALHVVRNFVAINTPTTG
jgi:nucleoside phosphorylase